VKLNLPACCCTAVVALMAIKTELDDPHNVLDNWDINSVDPCSWRMVTCSADGYVSALYVCAPMFLWILENTDGLFFGLIFSLVLCVQRSTQPELVRKVVSWHWQPHQAAICVSSLVHCCLPMAL
jgi:hypothetical protein